MEEINTTTVTEEATMPDSLCEDTFTASEPLGTTPKDTEEASYVTVKYNHNEKNLSLKEAADIIQKNMCDESSIKNLQFLAANKGVTLPEFVNEIFEANEKEELMRLKEQFEGDDESYLKALNARKAKNEEAFLEMLNSAEPADLNKRIADEYFELIEQFPEIKSIEDLPESVLKAAADSGKSLEYCYLLHKSKEQEKLLLGATRELENLRSSANSFRSEKVAGNDPAIEAMLKGIRK